LIYLWFESATKQGIKTLQVKKQPYGGMTTVLLTGAHCAVWQVFTPSKVNLEDVMQTLQLFAVLLLSLTWATAQTTATTTTPAPTNDSSASQSNSSPTTTTTTTDSVATKTTPSTDAQMSETSAGGDWVQGCLSGSDGNYTLTDQSGTSYRLTGDTAKLSEHIGHEVKIAGTKSTAAATGASDTMGKTNGAQQAIQVSSVKHISKTCQSGSPMNK
jgi:hypothetical protein